MEENIINSVVKIKYLQSKGLQLLWNFKGCLDNNIFHNHLMIVDLEHEGSELFLQNYFKKIKPGDLFCIITNFQKKIKMKWRQKTYSLQFEKKKMFKKNKQKKDLIQIVHSLLEQIGNTSQLLILTILWNNLVQEDDIFKVIKKIRIKTNQKLLVYILGNYKNNINFNDGINTFQLIKTNCHEICDFLKFHLGQISVINAQLQIQNLQGSFTIQNSKYWNVSDFSKISKHYYGLTTSQIKDMFHFLVYTNAKNVKHRLLVKIKFLLINGRHYKSQKIIELDINQDNIANRTSNFRATCFSFEIYKSLYLERDPFNNLYYIWISKQESTTSSKI